MSSGAAKGGSPPIRVRTTQATYRVMLTALFSRNGLLVPDFLPPGETFNSKYLTTRTLPTLEEKVGTKGIEMMLSGWRFILITQLSTVQSRREIEIGRASCRERV